MLSAWAFSWQSGDKQMAQRWLGISGDDQDEELSIWWQDPDGWCNSVIQRRQRHELDGRYSRTVSAASSVPFATRRARSDPNTETQRASGSKQSDLSNFDEEWVTLQAELAKEAADVMRREFRRETIKPRLIAQYKGPGLILRDGNTKVKKNREGVNTH
jgi:hypothetical protein